MKTIVNNVPLSHLSALSLPLTSFTCKLYCTLNLRLYSDTYRERVSSSGFSSPQEKWGVWPTGEPLRKASLAIPRRCESGNRQSTPPPEPRSTDCAPPFETPAMILWFYTAGIAISVFSTPICQKKWGRGLWGPRGGVGSDWRRWGCFV